MKLLKPWGKNMISKNAQKLESINQKIAALLQAKSKMENDFVENISQKIAKILARKNAFNFNESSLLKTIEAEIDSHMLTKQTK